MPPAINIGATGFSLIAVCYGFARFAFGLFLPAIREDLALSTGLAGLISGGAFLAYCVAIIIATPACERFGARPVAVIAALVAAIGMLGIAWAPSAIELAGFVIVAGTSTGLASPPMAEAVANAVALRHQNATNTFINAGTSAGVAVSGPIALVLGERWRLVFLLFAAVALMLAAMASIGLPTGNARNPNQSRATRAPLPPLGGNLARLVGAAFLMGVASTALWSFGATIASQRLGWSSMSAGLLWIAIGAAGIIGAAAGWLVARLGINRVHRMFLALLAIGIGLTGMVWTTPTLLLIGGILFGAAYVMLTGVYLVWGTTTLPERPATGLMIGFLAIATGQAVGAPIFGFLTERASLTIAVGVFATIALSTGVFSYGGNTILRPGIAR